MGDMLAEKYARDHAKWLRQQREYSHEQEEPPHVEPPGKKAKDWKSWLQLHYHIVQTLIEEPMFAQPKVNEPALEICIIGAHLFGPWSHPFLYNLKSPFVRHYIDTEMVGETPPWNEEKDPRAPRWNYKMLVLPRGARVSNFEVLNNTNMPLVLGDCAYATETLWKCATNCGRFMLDTPICHMGREVGTLQIRVSVWDGMPLEEETRDLGLAGTLAGAVDTPFMREFGPTGYRAGSDNPYPHATYMASMAQRPMEPMSMPYMPGAMPAVRSGMMPPTMAM